MHNTREVKKRYSQQYIVTRTVEKGTSEGMPRTEPIMAQGGERVWSGGEVGSGMVMDHRGWMGWDGMATDGELWE